MNTLSFEDFQNFSKAQVEAATSVASSVSKGFQEIASETSDYAKHSMTAGAEAAQRLFGARTVESAMQIQADYAKSAYEAFVARATKINEIFVKVAGEAAKPAERAFAVATSKP